MRANWEKHLKLAVLLEIIHGHVDRPVSGTCDYLHTNICRHVVSSIHWVGCLATHYFVLSQVKTNDASLFREVMLHCAFVPNVCTYENGCWHIFTQISVRIWDTCVYVFTWWSCSKPINYCSYSFDMSLHKSKSYCIALKKHKGTPKVRENFQ